MGNPSHVKTRRPHFREGLDSSPQKDDGTKQPASSPAACKNPPPPLQNIPFDPMAFLKEWGEKMQMMNQQHQPQRIFVKSRADKSRESEAKFNNHMLQLLLISGNVDFLPLDPFRYHGFWFTRKLC